jgi:hypothetical protein
MNEKEKSDNTDMRISFDDQVCIPSTASPSATSPSFPSSTSSSTLITINSTIRNPCIYNPLIRNTDILNPNFHDTDIPVNLLDQDGGRIKDQSINSNNNLNNGELFQLIIQKCMLFTDQYNLENELKELFKNNNGQILFYKDLIDINILYLITTSDMTTHHILTCFLPLNTTFPTSNLSLSEISNCKKIFENIDWTGIRNAIINSWIVVVDVHGISMLADILEKMNEDEMIMLAECCLDSFTNLIDNMSTEKDLDPDIRNRKHGFRNPDTDTDPDTDPNIRNRKPEPEYPSVNDHKGKKNVDEKDSFVQKNIDRNDKCENNFIYRRIKLCCMTLHRIFIIWDIQFKVPLDIENKTNKEINKLPLNNLIKDIMNLRKLWVLIGYSEFYTIKNDIKNKNSSKLCNILNEFYLDIDLDTTLNYKTILLILKKYEILENRSIYLPHRLEVSVYVYIYIYVYIFIFINIYEYVYI